MHQDRPTSSDVYWDMELVVNSMAGEDHEPEVDSLGLNVNENDFLNGQYLIKGTGSSKSQLSLSLDGEKVSNTGLSLPYQQKYIWKPVEFSLKTDF